MRMGQGVRTGIGHRGITCVLQTQFSSYEFIHQVAIKFRFSEALQKKYFQSDIIFRHYVKMTTIKFCKRLRNLMISISLSEKFCC